MSVWAYCAPCGKPLPMPVLADAIIGHQTCECGAARTLSEWDRRELINHFSQTLVKVVNRINRDLRDTRPDQG